jgi:hypothetical protein
MKLLDMLDKDDLKREYKLAGAFIKRHTREMGGFGKPLTFERSRVEAFLQQVMDERQAPVKPVQSIPDIGMMRRQVVGGPDEFIPVSAPGRILGKGGKGRAA